jgi:hypothetical protein
MKTLPPTLACSLLVAEFLCALPTHAAEGPTQPRRMFVTSARGTGDLGSWPQAGAATGVAAGDAICQALAAAAGMPNSGGFAAWLSDGTTDAYCHLLGVTGTRAGGCGAGLTTGPWLRTDGLTFSGDFDELTATGPIRPAIYDETGTRIELSYVPAFTGTHADGSLYNGESCGDWTEDGFTLGRNGRGARTVRNWTEQGQRTCNSPLHLFCFETGEGVPLPEQQEPGGLVFTTSAFGTGDLGSWPEAGGATGLAAGDAICRTLAADAGLPDPEGFVAWLSDSTTDAIDRLGGFPGPWKRVDGVQAVRLGGPFGPELDTSLSVTERRETVEFWAWTGTDGAGGSAGFDCAGWTVGSGATQGWSGWVHDIYRWTADGTAQCSDPDRIYCFGTTTVLFFDRFESGDLRHWSATMP